MRSERDDRRKPAARRARAALFLAALLSIPVAGAADEVDEDPVLVWLGANEISWLAGDHFKAEWDAEAWIGRSRTRFYVRKEGLADEDGASLGDLEFRASRAIGPFWNLVGGLRSTGGAERHQMAMFGVQGLGIYHIETKLTGFASPTGRVGARLELHQEWYLSQSLMLSPGVDVDWATGDGPRRLRTEAEMRLLYTARRDLTPFVGVRWEYKDLHGTGPDRAVQFVVGIAGWR